MDLFKKVFTSVSPRHAATRETDDEEKCILRKYHALKDTPVGISCIEILNRYDLFSARNVVKLCELHTTNPYAAAMISGVMYVNRMELAKML